MTTARTTFTTPTDGHQTWRLPVDERSTDMDTPTTQSQPASPHLTAARHLLDEVSAATQGSSGDAQAKASAATAHAILVLAEQVAAARLTMALTHQQQQHQQPGVTS